MRTRVLPAIAALAALLGANSIRGDDNGTVALAEKAPVPLTTYEGRAIAQTMHWMGAGWLIRNKREKEESASRMREELHLKPGMNVCDMGSGNGYHTLPMAQAVAPDGKVFAVDIQPEMLDMLSKRADAKGIKNVELIAGLPHDPKLPAASCDVILMVDVYHEFAYPVHMLAGMHQALKPGGQIVLVEYRAEDETVPIKPEHKMSKAQVIKEMAANGFKLTREFEGLPWQHMLWFGREGDPAFTPASSAPGR